VSTSIIGPGESVLVIGDTGDGKTAMFGELAEYQFALTKQPARLYMFDQGGAWETVKPHIELGIIELVRWMPGMDPWAFANAAVQGQMFDPARKAWTPGKPAPLYGYEGLSSLGDAFMNDITKKAASGAHKGGEDRFTLQTEGGKVTSNNRTDYNLVQLRLRELCWQSQTLPGAVMWTAALNRSQDEGMVTVLGPQLVGKAMTADVPRWFKYTFRVASIPAPGVAPRHVLYLEDHLDAQAGMAKGLGNARVPLAGAEKVVPFSVEPASIVKALTLIKERNEAAKAEIARRVGLKIA
jgi:hypothetical protein